MTNKTEEYGFESIGKRLESIAIPDPVVAGDRKLGVSHNSVTCQESHEPETRVSESAKKIVNPIKYVILGIVSFVFKNYVLSAIIMCILGIIVCDRYNSWIRSKTNAAFASEFAIYQTYNLITTVKPHLTSKLVVYDMASGTIDQIYYELPDYIKASNPSEVGVSAFISCSDIIVGEYTSGSLGYRTDCLVSVIDRDSFIKYDVTIVGEDPPKSKKGRGDWRQRPMSGITNYLLSLYR